MSDHCLYRQGHISNFPLTHDIVCDHICKHTADSLVFILGQTISSSVIEGDPESSQSQIVISSDNELQGNYKLVMVTAANDSGTEYMFSQSGKGIQLYRQVRGNVGKILLSVFYLTYYEIRKLKLLYEDKF